MISDRDLQELFARKATEMEFDRSMPRALGKRVRRRQGLIALTGAAAVVGIAAFVWMGIGSPTQSEAIPPAREQRIEVPIEGRAPTPERLAGVWVVEGDLPVGESLDGLLLRVSPDGTFAFDDLGQLDTTPVVPGTYDLNEDTISFTVEADSRGLSNHLACDQGDSWTWRARFPEEGRMHLVFIEDGTGNCSMGVGTRWEMTRISPISPRSAGISAVVPVDEGTSPSPSALQGIWLQEGTGRLLSIHWDGSYVIDDSGWLQKNSDDAGTFDVNDRGTLTFTSDAKSRVCPEGAVTVWRDLRVGLWTMQSVIREDECTDSIGTEQTWIRLSSSPGP